MASYRKLKQYYYIDFFIEIIIKASGLSCRSFCGKKKNLFLFLYSSSIVFTTIYLTIFIPYSFNSGDITDRFIDFFLYCFNATNVIVTYWSNVLREKRYWQIRSDLENLDLDHIPLERKKYRYQIVSSMHCFIFAFHILYLYMCFLKYFTAISELSRITPFLRLLTNYYCSMSTCRVTRLLSLIEIKYVSLNSQYENFEATVNVMSDCGRIIGMDLNMDEIRLDLLKKYKKINLDLGNAVEQLQKQFSLGLLVDITRGFYLIFFGTYWIIRGYQNYHNFKTPFKLLLSVFLQIVKVVTLASVCSGIEDEIIRSKVRVDKIIENCNTKSIQIEVMSLVEEVRKPVFVSACGMFNINYMLLLQMAGGFLTNIVLILQLRFPGLL